MFITFTQTKKENTRMTFIERRTIKQTLCCKYDYAKHAFLSYAFTFIQNKTLRYILICFFCK